MVWLIILGIALLFGWLYFRFFKIPKIKNVVFVDGSLGSGKTFYCVYLAIKLWKRQMRLYRFRVLLSKIPYFAEKWGKIEKPVLISNIPLRGVDFQPLTLDILLRKKRVPYRSVILMDEISLIADQFDYKDRQISDALRDFFKLWRHESRGGYLVINSQSISDLHYSLKAVISDYLYIHHKSNWPVFACLQVQEMAYCNDQNGQSIVNVHSGDVEDNLKMMLVPKRVYRKYDTYCFSVLTDWLDYDDRTMFIEKGGSLKVGEVVTFKHGRYKVTFTKEEDSKNGASSTD